MRSNSRLIGVVAATLVFAAAPLIAQGKSKAHGNDNDKGKHKKDRPDVVVVESNGRVGKVPPGLAKKQGQMPPGQYKKRYTTVQGIPVLRDVFVRNGYTYVRSEPYGQGHYVWYRTPSGEMQRAIIMPGTTQLSFSNVPALVLQQVLTRLY